MSKKILQFRPLFDKVLVRRLLPAEQSIGGIIIPTRSQTKVHQGYVVAVGPGSYDKSGKIAPLHVKPGDKVYLTEWGGSEIELNDETLQVLREEDLLGIIEESS
eukprot:TRINITY_DN241_c0_g1_i1.p1 TRINITY_DN241_c0_g1~~TRINITY_DN241_c0_g1_i1.p1  ORF type:complete len:117 (-),score=35.84 TRINITY_DN241_c0_g1_i1:93-404(-)